jgi:hypothetical protein
MAIRNRVTVPKLPRTKDLDTIPDSSSEENESDKEPPVDGSNADDKGNADYRISRMTAATRYQHIGSDAWACIISSLLARDPGAASAACKKVDPWTSKTPLHLFCLNPSVDALALIRAMPTLRQQFPHIRMTLFMVSEARKAPTCKQQSISLLGRLHHTGILSVEPPLLLPDQSWEAKARANLQAKLDSINQDMETMVLKSGAPVLSSKMLTWSNHPVHSAKVMELIQKHEAFCQRISGTAPAGEVRVEGNLDRKEVKTDIAYHTLLEIESEKQILIKAPLKNLRKGQKAEIWFGVGGKIYLMNCSEMPLKLKRCQTIATWGRCPRRPANPEEIAAISSGSPLSPKLMPLMWHLPGADCCYKGDVFPVVQLLMKLRRAGAGSEQCQLTVRFHQLSGTLSNPTLELQGPPMVYITSMPKEPETDGPKRRRTTNCAGMVAPEATQFRYHERHMHPNTST